METSTADLCYKPVADVSLHPDRSFSGPMHFNTYAALDNELDPQTPLFVSIVCRQTITVSWKSITATSLKAGLGFFSGFFVAEQGVFPPSWGVNGPHPNGWWCVMFACHSRAVSMPEVKEAAENERGAQFSGSLLRN